MEKQNKIVASDKGVEDLLNLIGEWTGNQLSWEAILINEKVKTIEGKLTRTDSLYFINEAKEVIEKATHDQRKRIRNYEITTTTNENLVDLLDRFVPRDNLFHLDDTAFISRNSDHNNIMGFDKGLMETKDHLLNKELDHIELRKKVAQSVSIIQRDLNNIILNYLENQH